MDLSALIFVVLALAWAVYLIPKALAHHDEVAGERLEEGHSEKVRVLTRRREPVAGAATEEAPEETGATVETEVEVERTDVVVRRAATALSPTARAARNRRRVLAVLLSVVVVVAVLAGVGVAPWWTVAVPAVLVVGFLVVARLSVRRAQQARRTGPAPRPAPRVDHAGQTPGRSTRPEVHEPAAASPAPVVRDPEPAGSPSSSHAALDSLADRSTDREQQAELEAALADEGSLWDPLPLTLPTYVGKATARRTVRTIELTGMTSSGHDDADTALARAADDEEQRATSADQAADRRAAGA